jgi:hypothetical protein
VVRHSIAMIAAAAVVRTPRERAAVRASMAQ